MKRIRRLLSVMMIIVLMASVVFMPVVSKGAEEIKISVNGERIIPDNSPKLIDGVVYVDAKDTFERLGAVYTYLESSSTVVIARDRLHIKLYLNKNEIYFDGIVQNTKLEGNVIINNGVVMVPASFIGQALGESVQVSDEEVNITSDYIKTVVVSDKVASLPSTFHRDIPRDFEVSGELGDWLYYESDEGEIFEGDLSIYGEATEIMSNEEFLEKASFSSSENVTSTKYGSLERVDVPDQDFTEAIRVNTHTLPLETTNHILNYGHILKDRVKIGDNILVMFKCRLTDGGKAHADGKNVGTVWVSLQHETTTDKIIWREVDITDNWVSIYLPATLDAIYTQFVIRCGYAVQTVEFADFSILNYGEEVRDFMLPDYDGKDRYELKPDAQWRKDAEAKIEQIRKGDFKVIVKDKEGNVLPDANVRFDMFESELPFGSVYQLGLASNSTKGEKYKKNFSKYFNGTVLESSMKWGNFDKGDESWKTRIRQNITEAKKLGGVYIRDHVIIYDRHKHASTEPLIPDDVMEAILDGNEEYVDERTKAWIYEISDRYAGEFTEIDVTNEISVCPSKNKILTDENGNEVLMLGGGYYKNLGPQYFNKVFGWVREVNPDARLCFTDTVPLIDPIQREKKIFPILDELIKNDNTFDTIGIHGHGGYSYLSPTQNTEMFNQYYDKYGATSSLTEFGTNSGGDEYDANYSRDVLITALANEHFNGIWLWGFQTYSENATGLNNKCFMDHNGNLKPAGEAMVDVIYNKCYTHDEQEMTDENGEAEIRGFYGSYDIDVECEGYEPRSVMTAFHKGYDNVVEIVLDEIFVNSQNDLFSFKYSGKINVSGKLTSNEAVYGPDYIDNQVTLILKKTDGDKIGYIYQTPINDDGTYSFDFKVDGMEYSSDYVSDYLMTLNVNGVPVTDSVISTKAISESIKFNLDLSYEGNSAKITNTLNNLIGLKGVECEMYAVFYGEDDRMTGMTKYKFTTTGEDEETTIYNDITIPDNTKMCSVFVWLDNELNIPLTKSVTKNIE